MRLDADRLRLPVLVLGGFAASSIWELQSVYARWPDALLGDALARAAGAGMAGAFLGWVLAVVLRSRRRN